MKRKCLICGKEFEVNKKHTKYCNKRCAKIAVQKYYHERNKKPPKVKKCLFCGKEFVVTSSNHKYCNKQCYYKSGLKIQREQKCLICGKKFIPRNSLQKYCNSKCYYKAQYQNTKNNPSLKLAAYMRSRIYGALKKQIKSASTEQLLGCSIEELWNYLESKFQPGMTRENYGQWHIDHIKPCASFDLLNYDQQKKCFHYTNLQPLWAKDNLSKGAKII